MKTSYIIYTNNSEDKIEEYINKFKEMWNNNEDELIIVDDLSQDQTVPIIVGTIGLFFKDEEHFKFYINTEKKGKTKSIQMAKKIATNRHKAIIGG
ncbi:MAG: glycosyltransferase family 2 protein [Clostridia bacterium]|jgi:glycosyltransferase involved in cell wall biosynthesis|nr:glycosyltransferase family 2 protein [Clostridia bacterium]